jgi:hypothetical protein
MRNSQIRIVFSFSELFLSFALHADMHLGSSVGKLASPRGPQVGSDKNLNEDETSKFGALAKLYATGAIPVSSHEWVQAPAWRRQLGPLIAVLATLVT